MTHAGFQTTTLRHVAASLVLLSLGACAWQKDLQEARLEADQCRLDLESLQKQVADQQETGLLKAQRDRLAAENEDLKHELAELRQREADLRQKVTAAEEAAQKAGGQSAAQREELQRALANIAHSRQRWEQDLADRQRQIDILTSQVEQLSAKLRASPTQSSPNTAPASQPRP